MVDQGPLPRLDPSEWLPELASVAGGEAMGQAMNGPVAEQEYIARNRGCSRAHELADCPQWWWWVGE